MITVTAARKHTDWRKDSQKYDIYTDEEGMHELLFPSQQPKAKDFRRHCFNIYFLMFNSSLVISHMRWKLKVL